MEMITPPLSDLRQFGLKILREASAAILSLGVDLVEGNFEKSKPTIKEWVFQNVPGDFLDQTVWLWVEAQLPALFAEARVLALRLKEGGIFLSDAEAHGLSGAIALASYEKNVLIPYSEQSESSLV